LSQAWSDECQGLPETRTCFGLSPGIWEGYQPESTASLFQNIIFTSLLYYLFWFFLFPLYSIF
jgi:hypothetical protein